MRISSILVNTYNFAKKGLNRVSPKISSLPCDTFEKKAQMNIDNICEAVKIDKVLEETPDLRKIINVDIDSYTEEYVKYLGNCIKKYPDLAKIIEKNQKIPINYVGTYNAIINPALPQKEIEYIKSIVGENSYVDRINNILPNENYIKWSALVPENCKKEKAKDVIKTIYDSIKTRQRLDSLYFKDIGNWALKNKTVIDCTTRSIEAGEDFHQILIDAGKGYGGIFKDNKAQRGQIRKSCLMSSPYDEDTYSEYQYRLDLLTGKERKSPFPDMELTQIMRFKYFTTMLHPQKKFIAPALKHAKKSYNEIMKYVKKRVSGQKLSIEELMDAEENIAQIHFIITNSLPFERGTAGVANIMTRSLYKALGIDIPAVKHNVALDLEAFCHTLDKYKQNWNTFFELPLS